MKRAAAFLFFWAAGIIQSGAQTQTLNLQDAVAMGVRNSNRLKLSAHQIEASLLQAAQAKDASLPPP